MTEILFSQDSVNLKSAYDSIMALNTNTKEEVLTTFFKENQNHPDQLGLSLCYHEYSRKIFEKNINTAIRYAKQAIAIRAKYQDTSALSKSLYALGYYYKVKGDYVKSVDAYTKILDFGKQDNLCAKTYNSLGVIYRRIGDFDKTRTNFIKARQYFKKNKKNRLLFRNHIDMSQMYTKMGWSNDIEIISHLQQADSLLKNAEVSDLDKMRLYQILGGIYYKQEKYVKAIEYHTKALEVSQTIEDSSYIAMNYNNLGLVYKKYQEDDNALTYFDKALEYGKKDAQIQAMVFNNLGDYYIDRQDFRKALDYYHKAIVYTLEEETPVTYTTMPDIEDLKISPYKIDLLGYITDKANAWITYYEYEAQEKYLEQALEAYKIADQLVDIIRFESTEFQSKLFWRAQSASLYIKAVEVCFLLDKPKEAFYFMEKNKALLLLEDRTQEKAKADANLPEKLSEREFDLRRLIHLAEEELNKARSKTLPNIDIVRDVVYDRKNEYEKFIDSLETGYPKYHQYKRKLQVVSYEESEIFLNKNNQVAVYYILNDTDGYGLVVANGSPQFFRITDIPVLHKNIKSLQQRLATPLYTKEEVAEYQKVAYNIYKTILPISEQASLKDKQLVVIPDSNLQHIPFEALMSSPTRKDSYLLNQCIISYAYSLSFLKLNEALFRTPEYDFIGFAPVHFADTTMVSLPRSSGEVTEIASLFSGDFYEESQASKSNFIEQASNYKIIHLSTHADVGEDSSPWIAFYDDKLSLEELYATKNQADLVVLSACKTSQGELKTGEGVLSLARGFFNTGTRSVVSTLWNANEKSTHEIMTTFYKNLKKGETKTFALQQAKREYLKKYSGVEASPYYWGAPILIGHTDRITMTGDFSIYGQIGIILMLLLISIWIWRYLGRKKQNT